MVRIVIKADKLAVDFPKHMLILMIEQAREKTQVPITEFFEFFCKGSELNMKFTKGYWMNFPA